MHPEQTQEGGATCLANLEATLNAYGCANVAELYRDIYKYNDCGPWLSVKKHDGTWVHCDKLYTVENGDVRMLKVGSIVEGVDTEIEASPIDLLKFSDPDDAIEAFRVAVEWVNDEVSTIGAEDDDDDQLEEWT